MKSALSMRRRCAELDCACLAYLGEVSGAVPLAVEDGVPEVSVLHPCQTEGPPMGVVCKSHNGEGVG